MKDKYTMYPIKVTEDLRGKLDLIGKENLICSFSFDKWNDLLLIEVLDKKQKGECKERTSPNRSPLRVKREDEI